MAFKGTQVTLTLGGTAIAGARTKTISLNKEPIDITSDDSTGWRELLGEAGIQSCDLSVEGVTDDYALIASWFTSSTAQAVVITFPGAGGTISGNFMLATLENTGAYNDAVTFSASLQSSGAVTYTPGT